MAIYVHYVIMVIHYLQQIQVAIRVLLFPIVSIAHLQQFVRPVSRCTMQIVGLVCYALLVARHVIMVRYARFVQSTTSF
jgi:hypothetical protein